MDEEDLSCVGETFVQTIDKTPACPSNLYVKEEFHLYHPDTRDGDVYRHSGSAIDSRCSHNLVFTSFSACSFSND